MTDQQYQRKYRDLYDEIDNQRDYIQYTLFECVKVSRKTKALIEEDNGYSEVIKEKLLKELVEAEKLADEYFADGLKEDVYAINNVIRPIQGVLQEVLQSF